MSDDESKSLYSRLLKERKAKEENKPINTDHIGFIEVYFITGRSLRLTAEKIETKQTEQYIKVECTNEQSCLDVYTFPLTNIEYFVKGINKDPEKTDTDLDQKPE